VADYVGPNSLDRGEDVKEVRGHKQQMQIYDWYRQSLPLAGTVTVGELWEPGSER
jgi:hypothetical protein